MKPYKVNQKSFKIEEFVKDYKHIIYSSPFKGDETLEYVMDILVAIASRNVLGVEDTYAYAYAMDIFGVDFFPNNIKIIYTYETKEDYNYGVPEIEWYLEGGN